MMFNDGVVTIGFATLRVGLPALCHIAFRDFSWFGVVSASLREAPRRSASVLQLRVSWLPSAHARKNGIFSRRRNDMLCDVRRRFSSVVSGGFLGSCLLPVAPWVGVAMPRVALLVSCLVVSLRSWILSRLRDDRRCHAWRHFATVLSCGFPGFMHAVYGISCRRRGGRRRFASVFSCAFTKLMYAICGIFCRRLDARCRFVGIVSYGVSMLLLAWFGFEVGVSTVGVATLSVGSIMSCRRASQGSSTVHIWNFCRRRDSRRRHTRRRFVSVVSCGIPRLICAKYGILCRRLNAYRRGSSWVRMCHVVCQPEGQVSFNNTENLSQNPKSLPRLKPRTVSGLWPYFL
jgi:hypothetical protein